MLGFQCANFGGTQFPNSHNTSSSFNPHRRSGGIRIQLRSVTHSVISTSTTPTPQPLLSGAPSPLQPLISHSPAPRLSRETELPRAQPAALPLPRGLGLPQESRHRPGALRRHERTWPTPRGQRWWAG